MANPTIPNPAESQRAHKTTFRTASEVKAAKPGPRVIERRDADCRGLVLRIMPSGSKSFWYVYKAEGRSQRVRIGDHPDTSLTKARGLADTWRGMRADASKPAPHVHVIAEREREAAEAAKRAAKVERAACTVRLLADGFIGHLKQHKRPRTWGEAARQIDRDVLPFIGAQAADAVTRADIESVLRRIARRGKLRQRNAVRTTLVWLFSWAAADGPRHLRGMHNPAAETAALKAKPARRRRALTRTELRSLWKHLKTHRGEVYADALALVLLTGVRASEAVGATWREIDVKGRTWSLPGARTKNGYPHAVALSRQAVAMLRRRDQGFRFVFPVRKADAGHARIDTLRKQLAGALDVRGLDTAVTVHELRHSFLTTLVGVLGYPQEVRRRVANHRTDDALESVYVHHGWDREAAEAWQAWADWLDG